MLPAPGMPGRIFIEEKEDVTKIRISQAQKSDAGTYKLILNNEVGKAEISFRLNVHGNGILASIILIDFNRIKNLSEPCRNGSLYRL